MLKSTLGPWVVLIFGAALLQTWPVEPRGRTTDWAGLTPVAGMGVLPLVMGGWSAPAADLLWIRANLAWERRDPVATEANLKAAIALEPASDYFRINAARMMAFDFPTWDLPRDIPSEVQRRRRRQHCRRALALLEAAPVSSAAVLIERARLTHQVLGDRGAAADLYRRAAERSDAPYFAGRLAAELLVQEGRTHEARAWLDSWIPRLPVDDPAAQRGRVEARRAELVGSGKR